MALGGKDPLLVILLKVKPPSPGSSLVPGVFDTLLDAIPGIPIPIYFSPLLGLTEGASGIFIDNETSAIDVETKVDPLTEKDPRTGDNALPLVSQTCVDAQVTINLVANLDSVILNVLLALMDLIVTKLVTAEYSINYLNGPSAIFGAKLHRFGKNVERNTNLVRMELVLSTASKDQPVAKAPIQAIAKISGTTPL